MLGIFITLETSIEKSRLQYLSSGASLARTSSITSALQCGNIYARGSADDKGQMYMHIKTVEALRAVNGTLPINLKFLVEGEVGGAAPPYNPECKSRAGPVASTSMNTKPRSPMQSVGKPSAYSAVSETSATSAFSLAGFSATYFAMAAPNPVFGLVELLSKCKDANGVIQVIDESRRRKSGVALETLEAAIFPQTPISPNRASIAVLGLGAGLLLGVATSIFRESTLNAH